MEMLEVEMEVDNVVNVVAEMVGDMEVDRVADELDMLVAKVAEMAGVKCVWDFMAVNILNCFVKMS